MVNSALYKSDMCCSSALYELDMCNSSTICGLKYVKGNLGLNVLTIKRGFLSHKGGGGGRGVKEKDGVAQSAKEKSEAVKDVVAPSVTVESGTVLVHKRRIRLRLVMLICIMRMLGKHQRPRPVILLVCLRIPTLLVHRVERL
ncbi:hypothetical protein Tco_0123736 [Tanacetum coccineum]